MADGVRTVRARVVRTVSGRRWGVCWGGGVRAGCGRAPVCECAHWEC